MCGRFTLRTPMALLAQRFLFDQRSAEEKAAAWNDAAGIARDESYLLQPRLNICPTQQIAAVRREPGKTQREFAWLRWGLIPSWAKDAKIAASMINARSETVAEKPAFRAAFKSRRCLILVDSYYEWLKEGKQKIPIEYRRPDGQPFAFAGLWETWRGPEGSFVEPWQTATILTTSANELAAAVHDRMPVILHDADYDRWLDPSIKGGEELLSLLKPVARDELQAEPCEPPEHASPKKRSPHGETQPGWLF
jgi:putative SOS response-associated peptidase YedK